MARLALTFLMCALACTAAADGARTYAISQKGRTFSKASIDVAAGDTIRFTNEDGFLHQIFVHSPSLTVDSDEQRPGENVDVQFPNTGTYRVLCSIHPKMVLVVNVR